MGDLWEFIQIPNSTEQQDVHSEIGKYLMMREFVHIGIIPKSRSYQLYQCHIENEWEKYPGPPITILQWELQQAFYKRNYGRFDTHHLFPLSKMFMLWATNGLVYPPNIMRDIGEASANIVEKFETRYRVNLGAALGSSDVHPVAAG